MNWNNFQTFMIEKIIAIDQRNDMATTEKF